MNSHPSRRDVVKLAGAASAAVGPFIQKVKAANDQVQYGFIGTGSRGNSRDGTGTRRRRRIIV